MSAVLMSPLNPSLDSDFIFPNAAESRRVQDAALISDFDSDSRNNETVSIGSDGLYGTADGLVWIPSSADNFQLRIYVVAHTGLGGHRGLNPTTNRIASKFFWRTLVEDVQTFCQTCLHCVSTLGGDRVPRPLGEAMHAEKPNELLHMDFSVYGSVKN
jgi:hypothetical protein